MKKGIDAIRTQIKRCTWEEETPEDKARRAEYRRQRERDDERYKSIQAERQAYYDSLNGPVSSRARDRWVDECACGAPCHVHIDQDGQRVIESHASGIYGSDVPCFWAS